MAVNHAIMATSCMKCGELFDLRYDLARYSSELSVEDVINALKTRHSGRQALCWQCRALSYRENSDNFVM